MTVEHNVGVKMTRDDSKFAMLTFTAIMQSPSNTLRTLDSHCNMRLHKQNLCFWYSKENDVRNLSVMSHNHTLREVKKKVLFPD